MYYPIMLKIKDRSCVVIGGGKVALRKTSELIKCEANITIISPEISLELLEKCREHNIQYIKSNYDKKFLNGAVLCFACTNDYELNIKIAQDAKELNIAVNVSDNGVESSFIVPAIRRKGDLTLAVTGNENPAASRYVADLMAEQLEDWLLEYISMTSDIRKSIKEKLPLSEIRQRIMKELFTEEYINTAKVSIYDAEKKANKLLEKIIQKACVDNE
ncbi:precorrin-2 dehydrogenase/sirohydrochlorin ferrochelatase family protein [Serpentinicella alkaliphila]|uniref:precorrin-2 dehydrogenase n=1 Tax=Serpentinicella alkaliphila TaxID=1734049 RepID=A0A4R2TN78_9FIRM|nr:bifunctional precorrin-2 dehydrogenase/sirohydrochlorin ferrochelatase [Serpentinicella alkaliphila]QUH27102.1 bifunctional precorrin-2 dehydrogenase/sirohydrochlorin ferrochelatase [Serpentinicella alkaliphila]TCQ05230.1 precorrin-2 dehydrogenase/sirohydrochlorin ferrochelatase [Serpentinicella alkaliphila]